LANAGIAYVNRAHVAVRRRREARAFEHELRSVMRLAGPLIVSQLGQVGMTTVDTILVGPLGPTPLAAAGLGHAIHTLFVIIAMGIIFGIGPLVSQAFGRGEESRCRFVLVQGLWVALVLSIPTTLLHLAGGGISRALGQDANVSALTGGYMSALALGILPQFAFIALRQYLEGMGHVAAPMVITFIGLALNVLFAWLLIYGVGESIPAMGVVGAGWATSIVRWVMLGVMMGWVILQSRLHPFRDVSFRLDHALLTAIAAIGLPIGLHFGLEVGLFTFAAVMMGWLGPIPLAAHQVTINLASTTFMVALGVSMAGSIRVGQRIGQHRPRAVRRAALGTYLLAIGFMAVCAILFVAMPRALIRLYTPNPEIIELGALLLLFAAAFQVFDGAQVAGGSILRGAAETRSPMLIAAFGYWGIGVPVAYVLAFPLEFGPAGIWAGLSIGLAVAAVLLAWRVRQMIWEGPFERLKVGHV
jgi:MATE family multidrug resistance protein